MAGVNDALERAQARLNRLDFYPRPVRLEGVRVVIAPWFFRLPRLGRYHGYALWRTIVLRRPDASDDLITHELCHIWQLQHKPLTMPLSYLLSGYHANPFERQARAAVAATQQE